MTAADHNLSDRMLNALRVASVTRGVVTHGNTVRALAARGLAIEQEPGGTGGTPVIPTIDGRRIGLTAEADRVEHSARHRVTAKSRQACLRRAAELRAQANRENPHP